MIALVEGSERQKTPNEIALNVLLVSADRHLRARRARRSTRWPTTATPHAVRRWCSSALLVCLIPTTIGALLSRDRHRRHGPAGAAQRAGDVRPRRRGRRRRRRAAARQDRHHHLRQPPGDRARCPLAGVDRGRARRGCAARQSLADETPGGPQSIVELAGREYGLATPAEPPQDATFVAVHRADPDERCRPADGLRDPQGRRLRGDDVGARAPAAQPSSAELDALVDEVSASRRHAARRRRAGSATGRRGCSASSTSRTSSRTGIARALRRAARHGHPHGDDHRRQRRSPPRAIADGGRRRRLPRRGHARGQAGADPEGAGGRPDRRDVRRRHQRRTRRSPRPTSASR